VPRLVAIRPVCRPHDWGPLSATAGLALFRCGWLSRTQVELEESR